MTQRRYDIDWLRVVAIGLLIIYHSAIAFQPWGGLIGFIQNLETIEWIWYPMSMLNMWRIPILFFVSGMGVYFSMNKRNLIQLLLERSQRILLPFLFGIIAIVPIHIFIWQKFYYQELHYNIEMSHLWFLQNIFVYTISIAPLAYLVKKTKLRLWIKKLQKISFQPLVFIITIGLFIIETGLLKPDIYTLYAYSAHGWLMGFIAFSMGFYIVSLGKKFWDCFKIWKWIYLFLASILYISRLFDANLDAPYYLNAIETAAWVYAVFGFFFQYANKNNKTLKYLTNAAYPVYIIHMIVQFSISSLIFPISINKDVKYIILSICTIIFSLLIYELVIKRIKYIRPLFGLKIK